MRCIRCGQAVDGKANFCFTCGAPLAPSQASYTPMHAPVAMQNAFDETQKRKTATVAILSGVGLLAAVILGLFAGGVLKFGASEPPLKSLQAKGQAPDAGSLQLPATDAPPVLQKFEERAVMPDDVRAWLLHLERVEAHKVELTLRQQAELVKFGAMSSVLGAAMGAMNPYDMSEGNVTPPDQITMGKFADLKPDWVQLIAYFNSVPPPQECVPLAQDYFRALNEIPGMTSDIVDVLNTVATDPTMALQKVSTMRNRSYNQIDRYFARADQRLKEICRRYDERKWFNIKTDVNLGGALGKFGDITTPLGQ